MGLRWPRRTVPRGIFLPDRIDQRVDLGSQRCPQGLGLRPVFLEELVQLGNVGGHPADVAAGMLERGPCRGEQQSQHEGRHGRDQGGGQLDDVLGIAREVVLRQLGAQEHAGDRAAQDQGEGGSGDGYGAQIILDEWQGGWRAETAPRNGSNQPSLTAETDRQERRENRIASTSARRVDPAQSFADLSSLGKEASVTSRTDRHHHARLARGEDRLPGKRRCPRKRQTTRGLPGNPHVVGLPRRRQGLQAEEAGPLGLSRLLDPGAAARRLRGRTRPQPPAGAGRLSVRRAPGDLARSALHRRAR